MLNKKAQGLSVTTIIVAIIGLIILVAIILMITGKLGAFGEGASSVASCENSCKSIGWVISSQDTSGGCVDATSGTLFKRKIISGKYSDRLEGKVCCCERAI
jgi:hypothetical protein